MRLLIVLVLLNIIFINKSSADSSADSVEMILDDRSVADSVKFNVLMDFLKMELQRELRFDFAFETLMGKLESLIYSTRSNYHKGRAYSFIGLYRNDKGEHIEAINYYARAINAYGSNVKPKRIAGALINTGTAYLDFYDYKNGSRYLLKGIAICEEHGYDDFLSNATNSLTVAYIVMKDFEKAKKYAWANLENVKKSGPLFVVLVNSINLAEIHNGLSEFGEAVERCNSVKKKILEYEFDPLKVFLFHQLARAHNGLGHVDSARIYFEKGIELQNGNYDKDNKNFINIDFGNWLIENNEPQKAIQVCFFEVKNSDSLQFLESSEKACDCLYEAYKKMGNDSKALVYYEKANYWADSIASLKASSHFDQLELQRKLAKDSLARVKEQELELLEKEKALAKKKRSNRIQYSAVIIIVLLLATALAIFTKFKISPRLASGLIFIFFILTFEFLLVVLDPLVDSVSNGEVGWKIAINTAIALVLFGIHQVSEKRLKSAILKVDR